MDKIGKEFTILGSRGFLGSHLLRTLVSRGHSVYTPDNINSAVFRAEHGNILYCIGLTADFRMRPFATIESHVCILNKLLKETYFKTLTYFSSTRVYQGAHSTTEDVMLRVDPNRHEDLYSLSKLAAEALCLHSGREGIKILRLSNLVGLRDDNDLFINQVLHDIVTRGSVTLHSSATSSKDYIWVQDAVDAVITMAASTLSGCYNLASGQNQTNYDLLAALRSHFEFELEYTERTSEAIYPEIDISKIRGAISWEPTEFSHYFRDFISQYKTNKGL